MSNRLKLLVIFALISYALSEIPCPERCICDQKTTRCLHQGLNAVPKAPEDTNTLDIRFNDIGEIDPGTFIHLHRLRSLLMNDNKLKYLRSGAFRGLARLKYLYLYRNKIKEIAPKVFKELERLEQLYLHVNQIHVIEPDTFSHMPRLERLYLHSNNVSTIPPGSFQNMPVLQKLRLDGNALICDCSMLWFLRMLARNDYMDIMATCYAPMAAAGSPIKTMKEEDFGCQPPVIMKDPQDVTVNFGDNVTFTCVVTGKPTPKIEWLRNSTTIPQDARHYEQMNNGTLMVHAADENDVAVFECMAKNIAGEVKSKPAKMIIKAKADNDGKLKFIVLPHDVHTHVKHSAKFDCVANGNPKPQIKWYFNKTRITTSKRITIHQNGSCIIKKVRHSDAGIYICEAERPDYKISAQAMLQILMAPVLQDMPKNQVATLGNTVKFRCNVQGTPKPIIYWYRNGVFLPPDHNIIFDSDSDGENLTIVQVGPVDGGTYKCKAENSQGIAEKETVLIVEDLQVTPPKITEVGNDSDVYRGSTVQIPCETDSPFAIIEWQKDGKRINWDDRIIIADNGNLMIKNATVNDSGRYECSASNEGGRDTMAMFLTVQDRDLPGDEYVNIALTEATRDVDQAIAKTMDDLFNRDNSIHSNNFDHLYRITRFPNAPEREVARAAEIYERALEKVKSFVQSGLKITSTNPFNYQRVLSGEHLEIVARLSGCVKHRELKDCSDVCFHLKFRSIDGSCNNFQNPTWGSSLSAFRRILFPVYENGFSQPLGWNKHIKYNGHHLPSARLVSIKIMSTIKITEDDQISHMVMLWGQWLDHDLDHGLPSVSSQTWDGVDCKKTCEYEAPCFPIEVPEGDPRVFDRRCIDFVRTSSVCGSGETSVLFGKLQPREQINQLTSFIDASQVYGFEKTVAEDLRDLNNESGLLRVGSSFPGKKPLLPTVGINGMDCRRNVSESSRNCFVAGDIRANEQISLTAMHTVWMREHNRIATHLKIMNPFWDGERIYQEARKIVGAQIQYITYEHWLPLILGPEGYQQIGKYNGYDSKINPSISNVFATAALRFGHSIINPILQRLDENFDPIPEGNLLLRFAFFSPWRLVDEGGVDPLLRGMFMSPAKLKTPTENLNSELTEQLFYSAHAVSLDLAAINIQRGRDHGLPPYTKWRDFCNMTEVDTFDDLEDEISDPNVRAKLKSLYGSVHNIDVFVGGILEDQVKGGKVGPLFRCILVEQFKRLRDGDRLWYENPTTFKALQIEQIKETSLARILCDNGDAIETITNNVFLLPEAQDGIISCYDIRSMDLRYWADCENCALEHPEYANENDRSRRSVPTENDRYSQFADLKERLIQMENTQDILMKTVTLLKNRIQSLEDTSNQN